MVQGFQQLAPMFSVPAGALGKKKGGSGSSANHTERNEYTEDRNILLN